MHMHGKSCQYKISIIIYTYIYIWFYFIYIYIYVYVCISKLVRAFYGSTPPPLGWWVVVLQVLQQFGDVPGQTPELWKFRGRETKKTTTFQGGQTRKRGFKKFQDVYGRDSMCEFHRSCWENVPARCRQTALIEPGWHSKINLLNRMPWTPS